MVEHNIEDNEGIRLYADGIEVYEISDEYADQVTPLDLLNSKNYTSKEQRDERFGVCKGCERFFKPTKTCKECGCFMALKTYLKDATCPLGKW